MSSVVPDGWQISSVEGLLTPDCLFSDGDWVESKDQDPVGTNRLLQLADIGDGRFINKSNRFMNDEQFTRLNCTQLHEGDILIARMPEPIGRACILPRLNNRLATVVDIAILRPSAVDSYWLMSVINSSSFRTKIEEQSSGTTRTRIGRTALSQIKLVTPPLPEQKKIASILTSVDEVIENTQKQIDKLQDLKKATMNQLLTKGIGHIEFKDSELGRIPKSWEVVSLLSVSKKIKRGPSLSCNTEGIGIRYITSGNLVSDEVSLDGDYKFLDNFTDIEKCRLLKNDLVLNCVNSAAKIGESAIFSLNIDAIVGFNNYAITFHTDICDPNFIHYFTKTHLFKRQLKSVIKDAINQVSFSTKDLDLIQIALPSKSEQSEISKNINYIWKNEKTLMQKLSQTQSLKKSLMQDLLTGKVRVKVN
jgi:type I restriction enzyme, S subunit